jgi:hypothetical protein
MAASKNSKTYLHVAIYFGGAELGTYSRPLKSSRGVVAGRGFLCDVRSAVWPRWDDLEVVIKTRSGLILNPDLPWDGVISDGSSTTILDSQKPSKAHFDITNSTSASLRLESMSVAIRVGSKQINKDTAIRPVSGYSGSFLSFFVDGTSELMTLGISALAAGVIAVSAHVTLMGRENDIYKNIGELPGDVLLPFISYRHLSSAPNVIQSNLDRFNYIHSVWNYYTDIADVVSFGKIPEENSGVFSTTIAEYSTLAKEQRATFEAAESHQEKQVMKAGPYASLSVPMVLGESLNGRALRALDKVAVVSAFADELAARRVTVAADYLKEIGYKYSTRSEGDKFKDALAGIANSYAGLETDDKMQLAQAEKTSARAALAQIDLFGKDRMRAGAVNCCDTLAGAPLTQDGLVWLAPEFRADNAATLAALKASFWGAPVKDIVRIKEPVVGHIEPSDVERTVSAGRYQLRLCYELALRRNQAAKGSMEWRWLIDTRGKIAGIDLLKSSIKDEELVRCVHDKIATWRFPKPRGGSVEVRYPFEFSRDKG